MGVPSTSSYMPSANLVTIRDWLGTGAINFLGLPGAGKGSQAKRLKGPLRAAFVDSGVIFRNRKGSLSTDVHRTMEEGALVASDAFLAVMQQELASPAYHGRPLLLGSVGKAHGEEEPVIQACLAGGHPMRLVVCLVISQETAWRRREGRINDPEAEKRPDDDSTSFAHRLQEYKVKTVPVLDFYARRGLLVKVDAEAPKDDVTEAIWLALYLRACTDLGLL